MKKVWIGSTSYDGRIQQASIGPLLMATANREIGTQLQTINSSSILRTFNLLWTSALTNRAAGFTHFAMVHDDVVPEMGWLDKMLEIMDRYNADVLSAIIPQKSETGFTSTAFDEQKHDGAFDDLYRKRSLTMKEVFKMPATFTAPNLLVNTGLMLVDLKRPWVEKISFRFENKVLKSPEGKFVVRELSEDWAFSRDARAAGAVLYATREVKVEHVGTFRYKNDRPWGTKE